MVKFRILWIVDDERPFAGLRMISHGSLLSATCYMVAIRVILTLMARGGIDPAAGGDISLEAICLTLRLLCPCRLLVRRQLFRMAMPVALAVSIAWP